MNWLLVWKRFVSTLHQISNSEGFVWTPKKRIVEAFGTLAQSRAASLAAWKDCSKRTSPDDPTFLCMHAYLLLCKFVVTLCSTSPTLEILDDQEILVKLILEQLRCTLLNEN